MGYCDCRMALGWMDKVAVNAGVEDRSTWQAKFKKQAEEMASSQA